MNLARSAFARVAEQKPFFRRVLLSGSHANSLARVASGAADAASIDCITYGLLSVHRPAVIAGCRILAQTAPSPAPPFVTSSETRPATVAALRRALAGALRDEHCANAMRALRLKKVVAASADDYRAVLDLERDASERGYPSLA
jgi:ABC-type phosphate/phosphonate transport system substrate-binding protein